MWFVQPILAIEYQIDPVLVQGDVLRQCCIGDRVTGIHDRRDQPGRIHQQRNNDQPAGQRGDAHGLSQLAVKAATSAISLSGSSTRSEWLLCSNTLS